MIANYITTLAYENVYSDFFHMYSFTWFAAIQLCQSDMQKCHEFSIENRKKKRLIKTSILMVVMGGSRAIFMFVTAFCFINWLQFWISLRPVAASSWYFKTICKLRTQCSLTFKNKHIWRDQSNSSILRATANKFISKVI